MGREDLPSAESPSCMGEPLPEGEMGKVRVGVFVVARTWLLSEPFPADKVKEHPPVLRMMQVRSFPQAEGKLRTGEADNRKAIASVGYGFGRIVMTGGQVSHGILGSQLYLFFRLLTV